MLYLFFTRKILISARIRKQLIVNILQRILFSLKETVRWF